MGASEEELGCALKVGAELAIVGRALTGMVGRVLGAIDPTDGDAELGG